MLFRTILTVISLFTGLTILFFSIRKPSGTKFLFFGFYILSVLGLSGQILSYLIIRSLEVDSITVFWPVFLIVRRAAYLLFIIFLYSLNRNRAAASVTVILGLLLIVSTVIENFFYSIIPQLVESLVLLYTIIFLFILKGAEQETKPELSIKRLIDILSYSTTFFGFGLALDLLENIPYTRPWFSLFAVDFYPVFILCIGVMFLYWLLRFSSLKDFEHIADPVLKIESLPVTEREREVIGHILQGKTNSDISEELFISESTVKKHINSIFKKLSVSSRWELLKLTGNSTKVL